MSDRVFVYGAFLIVPLALVLIGLVGLYARLRTETGRLERADYALSLVGIAARRAEDCDRIRRQTEVTRPHPCQLGFFSGPPTSRVDSPTIFDRFGYSEI